MNTEREGRRRRCRGERGAGLVEFAFIFPIFITVVLGMFTGGVAYNQKSAMTSATREGARYASTLPIDSFGGGTYFLQVSSWLHNVANYVATASEGSLGGTVPGWQVCIAYVHRTAAGVDESYHETHFGNPATGTVTAGQCPSANDVASDEKPRVQVVSQRSGKIQALFFNYNLTLRSKTITRFEAVP